jgi:hypothetical protein
MKTNKLTPIFVAFMIVMVVRPLLADETRTSASTETNANATGKLSDDQLGDLLQQAIMLGRVGLYDEAEARCKQILEQKPDQPTVKQLLREIEEQKRRIYGQNPGYDLTRKLSETVVPEVKFRDANAFDVLDTLQRESKKLTADKSEINLVWQVPPDAKLSKITLNLKQVPMLDVIKYVTAIAKLSYRVDARAVVIYPAEPEPAPVPTSGASSEPNAKPQ